MVLMKVNYKPQSKQISSKLLDIGRWLLYVVSALLVLGFIGVILYSIINENGANLNQVSINIDLEDNSLSSVIVESEKKLEEKQSIIKELDKRIQKTSEESLRIEEKTNILSNDISQIQNQVAEYQDSFVNVTTYASDSAGNLYAPGHCTYYVKQMRPDIPNDLGNANQWLANATAEGYKTGKKPKVGAIGVSYEGWAGHVVYVQKLKRNGNVVVSEMNYGGLWNKNTREVPSSSFDYIYSL